MLFHLPHRYLDRTRITAIGALPAGGEAVILGRIEQVSAHYGRRRSLLVRVADDSGEVGLRFFHFSAAQQRGFRPMAWICCYGEARPGLGPREMIHPEYRIHPQRPDDAAVTEAGLTPIYPSTEGLSASVLRRLVAQAMAAELAQLPECLPPAVRQSFGLRPIKQALQTAHCPPPAEAEAAVRAATTRLAVEELLAHHLALRRQRDQHRKRPAPICGAEHRSWEKLRPRLGFALTAAQGRVIEEIFADLRSPHPAMRLIQGDVGCGKTVLAAAAALCAIDAGYQTALMAPTELLSEQHRQTFTRWFGGLDISVEWLAGKMPASERRAALARIQSGAARMIIGTHALFQKQVTFHHLGLLIVDEQHRFGVDQRLALRNKGGRGGGVGGNAVGSIDGNATPGIDGNATPGIDGNATPGIDGNAVGDVDGNVTPGIDGNAAGGAAQNIDGEAAHQLIMSATPIPRSLAMIFHADLDISSLDELPPGRKAVRTVVVPASRRLDVAQRVRHICRQRRQAYWVCPLIDESDKLQAQAATETFESLRRLLPELRIELIHGRMKSALKDDLMRRFHGRDIDLLVATTVIEVGVDVPTANLMIIDNAERLGLAQLHQLRGRVGRGAEQATCVLMYQPPLGKIAKQRLGILRATTDGFEIARQDLAQRGAGDLLGTRQAGLQRMKIADLARDRALLPTIEKIAAALQPHPEAVDSIIRRWLNTRESYAEV